MEKDNTYYPSVYHFNKYTTYVRYFYEFLKFRDYKSLRASYHYLLKNRPPVISWQATSRLGTFNIRQGTNDFIFINYAYEKKIRDYLKRECKNITCFIDVGACIGEFCVWLAGKNIRCIAFEPVNFEAAKNNILLNNLENKVEIYNCGLGSNDKQVFFDVNKINTGSSRIDRSKIDETGNIHITTLDKVIPAGTFTNADNIMIKLDVEGMELDVIEGGKKLISNTMNLSIILEHSISSYDELCDKLSSMGNFEFRMLDKHNTLAKKKAG